MTRHNLEVQGRERLEQTSGVSDLKFAKKPRANSPRTGEDRGAQVGKMRHKTRHGCEGRWAALSCLAWEQGIAGAPLAVSGASPFFFILENSTAYSVEPTQPRCRRRPGLDRRENLLVRGMRQVRPDHAAQSSFQAGSRIKLRKGVDFTLPRSTYLQWLAVSVMYDGRRLSQ
jgi:hypothetical protein